VLGADLAATMGVATGDVVWAVTPLMTLTPYGRVLRQRPLEVVGTFRYGFYELDTQQALVSMKTAEELVQPEGPDLIQLKLADMNQAPAFKERLQTQLGLGYQVQDWTEVNRALYSALWLEKVAISMTIGLIVMVAALNIVASLVLLVMEKSRDIAILRTMGAPARSIRRIFVLQGLTIGLTGTVAGTVLGLTASYLMDHYRHPSASGRVSITYLPFRIQAMDVAPVVVSAIGVCLIATVYPSRHRAHRSRRRARCSPPRGRRARSPTPSPCCWRSRGWRGGRTPASGCDRYAPPSSSSWGARDPRHTATGRRHRTPRTAVGRRLSP
jgi:lipoprotein-releasing system permease protein